MDNYAALLLVYRNLPGTDAGILHEIRGYYAPSELPQDRSEG